MALRGVKMGYPVSIRAWLD
ncbi:uncharacterized protein G2W53_005056 [Senna tora]|uniref:Uncharacterized protein n=1 Tax=Senna tora TaxID=362788 RepID=A0A834XGD4_9FABA|nr:uncharacterized protein G2W53_005056 [Senna tora]